MLRRAGMMTRLSRYYNVSKGHRNFKIRLMFLLKISGVVYLEQFRIWRILIITNIHSNFSQLYSKLIKCFIL